MLLMNDTLDFPFPLAAAPSINTAAIGSELLFLCDWAAEENDGNANRQCEQWRR
jgi:hypothetical protein